MQILEFLKNIREIPTEKEKQLVALIVLCLILWCLSLLITLLIKLIELISLIFKLLNWMCNLTKGFFIILYRSLKLGCLILFRILVKLSKVKTKFRPLIGGMSVLLMRAYLIPGFSLIPMEQSDKLLKLLYQGALSVSRFLRTYLIDNGLKKKILRYI